MHPKTLRFSTNYEYGEIEMKKIKKNIKVDGHEKTREKKNTKLTLHVVIIETYDILRMNV